MTESATVLTQHFRSSGWKTEGASVVIGRVATQRGLLSGKRLYIAVWLTTGKVNDDWDYSFKTCAVAIIHGILSVHCVVYDHLQKFRYSEG